MKLVVASDLHIHNYKPFLGMDVDRLQNCIKVLEEIFAIAAEENASGVLFCGDLFNDHSSIPMSVVNETSAMFKHCFEKYNINFYAISGNHDMSTKSLIDQPAITGLTYLDTVFPMFHLVDRKEFTIGDSDIIFAGIPYYDHPEHMLEEMSRFEGRPDIYLIHNTPEEISNKNIKTDFNIDILPNAKMIFCGHIHKTERLRKNFIVVGSPLHRDYGDVGERKGILIYDTDDDSVKQMFLNDYPMLERIDVIKELNQELAQEVDEEFVTTNTSAELIENYINKIGESPELIEIGLRCLKM